jgi:predicted DNA-binding WGR domain protein
MIVQAYRVYVERADPARNMARFYAMAIEPTLFGEVCLTRCWGRIGARGRMIKHSFAREDEAVALFLELLRRKRQRGYRPKGLTTAARRAVARAHRDAAAARHDRPSDG